MTKSTAYYEHLYYEGRVGPLPVKEATASWKIFLRLVSRIKKMMKTIPDISVKQAYVKVTRKFPWQWPFEKHLASWFFVNLGHLEGVLQAQLSAKFVDWQ